ncbi:MAG: DUF2845 domain-containing protein [Syntrophaceae bacterium]|jgi:hypothetical protein
MKLITLIGAMILIFSSAAFADSILCEKGVVETGTPKAELLEKCGQPLKITPGDNSSSGEILEIWRYEIDGLVRDIYIEKDVLKTIEDIGLAE